MNGTPIDARLAELTRQLDTVRTQYKAAVLDAITAALADCDLTLDDLTAVGSSATKKAAPIRIPKAAKAQKRKAPFKGPQPPKYQHPDGSTWSGFGRAPAWITQTKDRDQFLINA